MKGLSPSQAEPFQIIQQEHTKQRPKDQKEKKPGSRFFPSFFLSLLFFKLSFDDDQQRSIFSFFGCFFEPHIFRFPGRREEFEKKTQHITTPTRGEGGCV